MDSRVVLDLFQPTPSAFLQVLPTNPPSTLTPLPTLRRSIKTHFPHSSTLPFPTSRLISIHSLPDLQRAILLARSQRRRVRASTGALSSSSNRHFLRSGGYVLDLSPISKLTHHPRRGVITLQAGASLRQLDSLRAASNLKLPVHIPLSTHSRSIGALLARGAIGAGCLIEGAFADHIVEISFVDAFGRLRVISNSDANGLFDSVRTALGLFGIIFDVTIIIPKKSHPKSSLTSSTPYVRVANSFVRLSGLFHGNALKQLLHSGTRAELFWRPFNSWQIDTNWNSSNDAVWVRTLTPVKERSKIPYSQEEEDVAFRILTLPQWLTLNANRLSTLGYTQFHAQDTKCILSSGFQQTAWKLETKPFIQPTAHAAQLCHSADSMPIVSFAISIPIDENDESCWKSLEQGWKIVTKLVEKYDEQCTYPLNFGLRTTFTKSSTALLAPNYKYNTSWMKNNYSASLEIMSAKHTVGWNSFGLQVANEWMKLKGARWHWSRESIEFITWQQMKNCLGDCLDTFKILRKNAAVDDYGMFIDDEIGDLLDLLECSETVSISPVSSTSSGRLSSRWKELDSLLVTAKKKEKMMIHGNHGGLKVEQQKYNWLEEEEEEEEVEEVEEVVERDMIVVGQCIQYCTKLKRWEWIMLCSYITMYTILWLVLFGKEGWQQLCASFHNKLMR